MGTWADANSARRRALTLLAAARGETTPEYTAQLSIGQRDAFADPAGVDVWRSFRRAGHLSRLRRAFGASHRGGGSLKRLRPPEAETQPLELVADDCAVHFRLPNSEDLAALVGCADVAMAHSLLIRRCVVQASRAGRPILSAELPVEVLDQLVQRMAACDPQAEVLLNLYCPACGYAWQLVFDIVEFLWSEICTQAQRMLRDVHTLARAYGWREADILSMSALRRQFYLNMVMQ